MNSKPLALVAMLSGCAMLPPAGSGARTGHQAQLPVYVPPGTGGVALARGPFTVLQVNYRPTKGSGRGSFWISATPSCPHVGPMALLANLDKFHVWNGEEPVGADQYLCASHEQNETEATASWVSQP